MLGFEFSKQDRFFSGSLHLLFVNDLELKFGFISKVSSMKLNLGPQHPSMHGVLRLTVEVVGESVVSVDVHIGLLHRGTEKLIEFKTYTQALPYMDRLDYVSAMAQEWAFSGCVEKLLGLQVGVKAQLIRVLYGELTRILNHLLAITTGAMDVGALTPFLWGFEEREKLMEFYERVSGARLHANYIVPGGVVKDLPAGLLDDIMVFVMQFGYRIDEIEEMLTQNRIFRQRTVDIGAVSYAKALSYGFTGSVLRASGGLWDLRLTEPYEFYNFLDFSVPLGYSGDCFDRYLVRIFELRESLLIIRQCLKYLMSDGALLFFELSKFGFFEMQTTSARLPALTDKTSFPSRLRMKHTMESMIHHFKFFSEGYVAYKNEAYFAIESPKGEFGIFLVSDNSNRPYRCSIKSPDLFNLFGLAEASTNFYNLADLIATIASVDVVLGSTDG